MSRTPDQRKKRAEDFQQDRVKTALNAQNAAYGAAALGLGADTFQGEADEGFSPGEFGANIALAGMTPAGALVGALAGVRNARNKGIKREKNIKARTNSNTLEGEFTQVRDLWQNDKRTDAKLNIAGQRGMAIGAAAMLVPTLLAARDQEKLSNQSASLM